MKSRWMLQVMCLAGLATALGCNGEEPGVNNREPAARAAVSALADKLRVEGLIALHPYADETSRQKLQGLSQLMKQRLRDDEAYEPPDLHLLDQGWEFVEADRIVRCRLALRLRVRTFTVQKCAGGYRFHLRASKGQPMNCLNGDALLGLPSPTPRIVDVFSDVELLKQLTIRVGKTDLPLLVYAGLCLTPADARTAQASLENEITGQQWTVRAMVDQGVYRMQIKLSDDCRRIESIDRFGGMPFADFVDQRLRLHQP